MIAPGGTDRVSATGGGDCLTEDECDASMPWRLSDVPVGVISGVAPLADAASALEVVEVAEGVRRCLAI
jgi:hypothetical protein